ELVSPGRLARLAWLGIFGRQWLWPAGGEILRSDLSPHGFEYRTTVQLEGCSPCGLDLGLGFTIQRGIGARLNCWKLEW
ncbi:MAG TPA: hypothetical protein VIG47_09750, partial [Gemmatimonadaceae bacterium]